MEGRRRSDKTRPFRNIYHQICSLKGLYTCIWDPDIIFCHCYIGIVYLCADTHALPEIDPVQRGQRDT